MDRLKGKTAFITGAARGLGFAMAKRFHEEGAEIIINDLRIEDAERAAEQVQGFAVAGDVSSSDAVTAMYREIVQRVDRLDILVNNAGASWGDALDEFPESGWDKVMDVNVKGIFFLTQKCMPLLRASANAENPARVINIGSIDGIKTPGFDNFSYGPSKAAVHHMTRQMAAHLIRENIIVNAIAPGPFPSWMLSTGVGFGGETEGVDWERVGQGNPSRRVGAAEDIAGLAIYLSSRAGQYTVGDVITCDGGAVAVS